MDNVNTLISLTFISTPTLPFSFLGLSRLLCHIYLNNQTNDITGILIFKDNQFTQILEGQESSVEKIWLTIQKDERHTDLQLLSKESIEMRSFIKWSMLFPESEKVIEYFPDMAEVVQNLEMPAKYPLIKKLSQ
jgi:hypothetical protein